jgi:hypothetical protein
MSRFNQDIPKSFEALGKQGIVYHNTFEQTEQSRHLFLPTAHNKDWGRGAESMRRSIAHRAVEHALRNESGNRSEFSWDADAWNDVFGRLRDDPCIEA